MEKTETTRTWARVRVDTLIWLGFALVLFALSGWLTHVVTKVQNSPAQRGLAVTFAGGTVPARLPTVSFTVKDKSLALTMKDIARNISTVRLGTFPAAAESAVSCVSLNRTFETSWAPATTDETAMSGSLDTQPAPRAYVLQIVPDPHIQPALPLERSLHKRIETLQEQAADAQAMKAAEHDMSAADTATAAIVRAGLQKIVDAKGEIDCSLPIDVAHDTYTSRSFEVALSEGLQDVFPHQVSLHEDDAQEIHVTNVGTGETLLASSITGPFTGYDEQSFHHAVTVRFAWESIAATSNRDILITVIGTLIALGAAALIEACRPYIERIVRVESKA